MKKMLKKSVSILGAVVIVLSVFAVSVSAAEDTLESATTLAVGGSCSGTLSATNLYDFYKCTLPSSGKVHMKFVSYSKVGIYISLYDSSGNNVDEFKAYTNYDLGYAIEEKNGYFNKGTFYIKVDSQTSKACYGNYSISATFTSANESFPETLSVNDDYIDVANRININKTYNGQLGYSDQEDFYEINIKSGCTATISGKIYTENGMDIYLLDSSYNTIMQKSIRINGNLNYGVLDEKVSLSEGVYYIKFCSDLYKNRLGLYSFSVNMDEPKTTAAYVEPERKPEKNETKKVVTTKSVTKEKNTEDITITEIYWDEDYTESFTDSTLYTYNNFTYQKHNSTVIIINYYGNDPCITIPSNIDGMDVVEIRENAFTSTDIKEIKVPSTIIKFGENAFGENNNSELAIVCDEGSAAEIYAIENEITYHTGVNISNYYNDETTKKGNQLSDEKLSVIVIGSVALVISAAITVIAVVKSKEKHST